ncbi:MAG: hypothetical protein C4308_07190 [Chitinophagaceae bacterium]
MYVFLVKQKDRSTILSVLHILIGLIFVFNFWNAAKTDKKDWLFSAIVIIAAGFLLITGLFGSKLKLTLQKHLALLLFESILIGAAGIYFWSMAKTLVGVSHILMGGTVLLFWIYLLQRRDGEKILISHLNIILPGMFGKRVVQWNELSNVLKKHDLLTLDFRNNKLLQVEVTNGEIKETEFNLFCRQQLMAHNN